MVEIVSGKIELKMDNVIIKDMLKWVVDEKPDNADKSHKTLADKDNSKKKLTVGAKPSPGRRKPRSSSIDGRIRDPETDTIHQYLIKQRAEVKEEPSDTR